MFYHLSSLGEESVFPSSRAEYQHGLFKSNISLFSDVFFLVLDFLITFLCLCAITLESRAIW